MATVLTMSGVPSARTEPVTYVNERFGTTATFPGDVFTEALEPPANGDSRTWRAADGATVPIYGSYNVMEYSPEQLAQARIVRDVPNFQLAYRKVKDNWVVLSGYEGEMVFYERHEIRTDGAVDIIHSLSIQYPKARRAIYDKLVPDITATLTGP